MQSKPTREPDIAAIKRLGQEYFDATNAGDAERCIATMSDDVVIMPANRPTIAGTKQLRALSQDYHATYAARYTLQYDEVESAQDFGFARATVSGTRTLKSDGSVEAVLWRNVWILKRQADGAWKFWRIIFNTPREAE